MDDLIHMSQRAEAYLSGADLTAAPRTPWCDENAQPRDDRMFTSGDAVMLVNKHPIPVRLPTCPLCAVRLDELLSKPGAE